VGYCRIVCIDNHSTTYIYILFIYILKSYSEMLCKVFNYLEYHTLVLPHFMCSVLDGGSDVSAQCICAVWNPGRWQHRLVSCER